MAISYELTEAPRPGGEEHFSELVIGPGGKPSESQHTRPRWSVYALVHVDNVSYDMASGLPSRVATEYVIGARDDAEFDTALQTRAMEVATAPAQTKFSPQARMRTRIVIES